MATASEFTFILNGKPHIVRGAHPNTTVLNYLRQMGLTGSKEGCAEGDCGACTVAILERDAAGASHLRSVNSCIMLLPMLAGRTLTTVEGVQQHPVQQCMVQQYGSQCGFCTPGFIMSMVEAHGRGDAAMATEQIADALCGNLCRCTGYRPIRDAMQAALQTPAQPLPQAAGLDAVEFGHAGGVFSRPTDLQQLLRARAANPDAVLVAGATEIGVDITKKAKVYPALISTEGVAALHTIAATPEGFCIGGAATLTEVEEALADHYPPLAKMLRVFASRQIRNRATLAGNLVTASPIGDMAPVLLAFDASIQLTSLRGTRTLPLEAFFVGYRKTAMAADEIVEAVILPAPERARRNLSASYKVSKRREMDISIVASAFRVVLDRSGNVAEARLAYGGVAPTPLRALAAELWLVGKHWHPSLIAGIEPLLRAAFAPIDDARSGAAYRRELVVSLFEKFLLGDSSAAMDEPLTFQGRAAEGGQSPADQTSRTLPHDSAQAHVTGAARYTEDQAMRRPMLEMWPVCSPHARAKITRRDAAAARAYPGVHAVLLAEDVPGVNDVGAVKPDEPLLAVDEALFHGQIVAVVIGETKAICQAAAKLVEVDYLPKTALLSIDDAVQANSFHTDVQTIRRGDAAAALDISPHRLSGTLDIGGQEHFYLESHAAWAEMGDDGCVNVVSSTQHPSEVQTVVAHVLDIMRHQVVVQSPRMGGAFGGKETQGNTWAALAALGASKTGKPVHVQLDRDVDMTLTGKRHPFFARYEAGFDDDGLLLALRAELISNGGWSLDLSQSICDRALFHIDNCYYVPNVEVSGRVAKTHVVSNTAFRGFGGPQGMLVIEEVMDRVARELRLRPEWVRERNLYRGDGDSNTTHYGQALGDNRIETFWQALQTSSDFNQRLAQAERWNASHAHVKRGIAITGVKFGISFTASFLNQAGALLVWYRDGSLQVNHGGTEMGQGLNAKMQGVVMRELGLPAAKIRMMPTSTDKVPNTSATAASSGADLNGAAVADACRTLRTRLTPLALRLLSAPDAMADALVFADDAVFLAHAPHTRVALAALAEQAHLQCLSLAATGYYRTPDLHWDRATTRGKPFHYFAGGAAVTEVEVDGWTGMKRVLRVDILHDVGDSLNPGIDRGQIEGGFVQGMGWLTGEELRWDAAGKLLTHSASTYQIPSFSDAPADFRVAFLPHAENPSVIHGSKAVGEPPLMLAMSVREALRDAVAAFGTPGGDVDLGVPATHEQIFAAVQSRLKQKGTS